MHLSFTAPLKQETPEEPVQEGTRDTANILLEGLLSDPAIAGDLAKLASAAETEASNVKPDVTSISSNGKISINFSSLSKPELYFVMLESEEVEDDFLESDASGESDSESYDPGKKIK